MFLIKEFAEYADYFAVNISSPNTVGLRDLQGKEFLGNLLEKITIARDEQSRLLDKRLPIFVKLSPDQTEDELKNTLNVILERAIDGIIATNTTISRDGIVTELDENGGLSGAPLTRRSTDVIRFIHEYSKGKLPIIAVGGIMIPEDAIVKVNAGASLVQIYTGLIYNGPSLIKSCIKSLTQLR